MLESTRSSFSFLEEPCASLRTSHADFTGSPRLRSFGSRADEGAPAKPPDGLRRLEEEPPENEAVICWKRPRVEGRDSDCGFGARGIKVT